MSNSRNKNKKIENITSERHRAIEEMELVEKRLKLRLIEVMQWGLEVLELLQRGLGSVGFRTATVPSTVTSTIYPIAPSSWPFLPSSR